MAVFKKYHFLQDKKSGGPLIVYQLVSCWVAPRTHKLIRDFFWGNLFSRKLHLKNFNIKNKDNLSFLENKVPQKKERDNDPLEGWSERLSDVDDDFKGGRNS